MDVGILIIRVVVGGLIVAHGAQKLFGWFGGPGPAGTTRFMSSLGYAQPHLAAAAAGIAEFAGGALLVVGFLTPVGSAAVIGVMVNVIVAAHLRNGLWNAEGGFEYPLVLGAVAAGLGFSGAGAVSIDGAIGWTMSGWIWGLDALAVGLISGVIVVAQRLGVDEMTRSSRDRADRAA